VSTTPEPLDPSFQITLPAFEGPLDLLLHLIKKHELEILDLPIAFVTERYVAYISMMEQLDLDIASEYLVMAATLAHIKSKMLLPPDPNAQEDEDEAGEEIDPRAELIRRLLEYQKYKLAAEQLGSRGIAGRDIFPRGADAPESAGPAPLADVGLFKLLDAFHAVLARVKGDLAFQITAEGVSIQDRMRQLVDLLRERRELSFEQLFEGQATIYDLVITFLALLEMAKRRLVRVYQADPHSPIHLQRAVVGEDEGDPRLEMDDEKESKEPEEKDLPFSADDLLDRGSARDRKPPIGDERDELDTSADGELEEEEELDRAEALEGRASLETSVSFEDEGALDRDAILGGRTSLDAGLDLDDADTFDRSSAQARLKGEKVPEIAPDPDAEKEERPSGPSIFDAAAALLDGKKERAEELDPDEGSAKDSAASEDEDPPK
jgi:segregation and condensation protein A